MTNDLWALHSARSAIGVAVFLQALEMLLLRPAWSDQGVWSWNNIRAEFPRLFASVYSERNFTAILCAQLAAAVLFVLAKNFSLAFTLFSLCYLVSLRWRGTFNGGSDYVTIQVLLALAVVGFFPSSEQVQRFAVFYLAFQLSLSYFIAGLAKLRERTWRSGEALTLVVTASNYATPFEAYRLVQNPTRARLLSWAIILFECFFPFAILNSQGAFLFLVGGLIFHLGVFWIFGLNRFVFAWIATYPAFLVTSQTLPF